VTFARLLRKRGSDALQKAPSLGQRARSEKEADLASSSMNLDGPDLDFPFGGRSTLFFERSPAVRPRTRKTSSLPPAPHVPGDWRYRPVLPRVRFPLIPLAISAAVHAAGFLAFNDRPAPKPVSTEKVEMMEVQLRPIPPEEEEAEIPEAGEGEPGEALAGVDAPRLQEIMTVPLDGALTQALDYASFLPQVNLSSAKLMSVPAGFRAGGAKGTAEALKNVFNIADLDRQPQPVHQPAPLVPGTTGDRLGRDRIRVIVEFIINTKGEVVSPRIVDSEAPELNEIALRGVLKWKFRPGSKGGKKVNSRMIQPLVFRFTDE
jgi:periplasmic protein TonB